jgi:hypothetical protein
MGFVDRVRAMDGALPLFCLSPRRQIAAIARIEDGEVDALLPTPLTQELLTMPCTPYCRRTGRRPRRRRNLQRKKYPSRRVARRPSATVTSIAAHPRFAAEPTPVVDPRRIEALRELGGQEGFLGDVIETFRADVRRSRRLTRPPPLPMSRLSLKAARLGQAAGHIGAHRCLS